jgi:hypothetical protein
MSQLTPRSSRSPYDQGPELELPAGSSGLASGRVGGGAATRQPYSPSEAHEKHTPNETLKLVVPAHRPIKRSTLSHILKQARLAVEDFERLL